MTSRQSQSNSPLSVPQDNSAYDLSFLFGLSCEYVERGWSVIPLRFKRPALSSWNEFRARRPSYDELRKWFGGELNGTTGIGIVTGSLSGLAVIDCDSKSDGTWWHESFPKSPLVVQTGGGGSHHYYRIYEGTEIRNRCRVDGRRIDVRAEGGYATAPPSLHENGQHYRWEQSGDYSLADVPYFDCDWIAQRSDTQLPMSDAAMPNLADKIRDIRAYVRSITSISGQGGHNSCYRVACLLRDYGLSSEDALSELSLWNQTNAVPPWSEQELAHKVRSVFRS